MACLGCHHIRNRLHSYQRGILIIINQSPFLSSISILSNIMNEILAQLICSAINEEAISGLDCFDKERLPMGEFEIVLNNSERIRISVHLLSGAE